MAHFLEHMLFLGTQNHPEENQFSTHVAEGGGSSNAYTSYGDFFLLLFHLFKINLMALLFLIEKKETMKHVITLRCMTTFGMFLKFGLNSLGMLSEREEEEEIFIFKRLTFFFFFKKLPIIE
ncbi:MAG: insulinase family protein [archaeon]|nr:insulinase family protein [archaeon]